MANNVTPSGYAQKVSETRGSLWGRPSFVKRETLAFFNPQLITDPVSLGFRVYFDFDTKYGLLAGVRDGKPVSDQEFRGAYRNCALAFLKRVGDTNRFNQLVAFINHLKRVSSELSFLMHSIDGLNYIRQAKPFHRFNGDDKIKIKCYETVDFAIQSISDLYSIIWKDDIGWREVLPANLRRFSCSIFVYSNASYQVVADKNQKVGIYDIFNGGTEHNIDMATYVMNVLPNNLLDENLDSSEQNQHLQDLAKGFFIKAPDKYNHVLYELSECEFLPHESGAAFASPSNKDSEAVSTEITFSFRWASRGWKFGHFSMVAFSQFILSQLQKPDNTSAKTKFDLSDKIRGGLSSITNNKFMDQNPHIKKLAEKAQAKVLPGLQSTVLALSDKYGSIDKLKKEALKEINAIADKVIDLGANYINGKARSLLIGNVYDEDYIGGGINALAQQGLAGALDNFVTNKNKTTKSLSSSRKLKPNENVYEKL